MEAVLVAAVMAAACVVAVVLFRVASVRLEQARQERLKAHLDWVNPRPASSRRRGSTRR